MTSDVWYVAGNGLLVGAERRWLLLDDVPDEAFVTTLWDTIAGSGVDRVLTLLESRYGDTLPSLAMIGAGREIARGSGEVTNDRTGVMLSLGTQPGGQRLPFRGGVVAAALVEIPADVPAGHGLIDGIPDDVLSAVGPDIPVRARQTARHASTARPDWFRRPLPDGDPRPRQRGRDDRPHPGVRRPDQRAAPADVPRRPARATSTAGTRWCARARATVRRCPCPRRSSSCCASTRTRR